MLPSLRALSAAPSVAAPSRMNLAWHMRGAWMLQESTEHCDPLRELCTIEQVQVLVLLISLAMSIVVVVCAFSFFREDKEEQITPLCPALVVKDSDLKFRLPLDSQAETMDVTDRADPAGRVLCKLAMDWPDPFRPGASGVAATVRLQDVADHTLATVVARNVAVVGQGLALCRAGCEIFGFVEADGERRYHVRHRTGVHLLTLLGDFDHVDIECVNSAGSKVCAIQKKGSDCIGEVSPHVDAGLIICSLLATHVHRRLTVTVPPPPADASAPPQYVTFARPVPPPVVGGSPNRAVAPATEASTPPSEPALALVDVAPGTPGPGGGTQPPVFRGPSAEGSTSVTTDAAEERNPQEDE